VATPAFARSRHTGEDTSQAYRDAIGLLVIVPLAFFSLISLLAEPIVRCLFGTAWLDAVPLLRIGALGGLLAAPYFLAPPILTAHGRVKSILSIQGIGGAIYLPALFFASQHSLEAVAIAGVLAGVCKLAIMQIAMRQAIGLSLLDLMRSCASSALIATGAVLATAPLLWLYDGSAGGAMIILGLAGLIAGASLTAGIFALKHPLAVELRKLRQKRTASAPADP